MIALRPCATIHHANRFSLNACVHHLSVRVGIGGRAGALLIIIIVRIVGVIIAFALAQKRSPKKRPVVDAAVLSFGEVLVERLLCLTLSSCFRLGLVLRVLSALAICRVLRCQLLARRAHACVGLLLCGAQFAVTVELRVAQQPLVVEQLDILEQLVSAQFPKWHQARRLLRQLQ